MESLVGKSGCDLLEDSREAGFPRHWVVVFNEMAQAVAKNQAKVLEMFLGDSLAVAPSLGQGVQGGLEGLGVVEQGDDVVEGEQHSQRVDRELAAVRVLYVDGAQLLLEFRVFFNECEESETTEADLEFGRLDVVPELVPLVLDGVTVRRRAAVVVLGGAHGHHGQQTE